MMWMQLSASATRGEPTRWGVCLARLCLVIVVLALQACTTVTNPDRRDPMEAWNRGVFGFNDTVDAAVVKPVAKTYKEVVPNFVRTGVGNFFNNLDDLWSGVNNALQLRALDTAESFGRFLINTTWGLGGLLDIASEMGMERHNANFGLTLGRWGVGSGPFVVIPFWGSSTLRDTGSMLFDIKGNLVNRIDEVPRRDMLTILNLIDTRATYLKAGEVVEEAALDRYSFTRDAYLQRRRNQVYDGNPPDEEEASDPSAEEMPR
jgi:phospholipid-binding lipoprotein MlaA